TACSLARSRRWPRWTSSCTACAPGGTCWRPARIARISATPPCPKSAASSKIRSRGRLRMAAFHHPRKRWPGRRRQVDQGPIDQGKWASVRACGDGACGDGAWILLGAVWRGALDTKREHKAPRMNDQPTEPSSNQKHDQDVVIVPAILIGPDEVARSDMHTRIGDPIRIPVEIRRKS